MPVPKFFWVGTTYVPLSCARAEEGHLCDLYWSLLARSVPLILALGKCSGVLSNLFSLTSCGFGQKLRHLDSSNVSTSVRGTFDAFRTGQVLVSVKDSTSLVCLLRLKRLDHPI